MRQQVDLAVLHVQISQNWFESQLSSVQSALTRIVCHELFWERDGEFPDSKSDSLNVSLRTDLLYHAAVRLRRYDALLLPVSMETIAWTRRLLASIPRGPSIPVIGVLNNVQPAAMVDLLELGMIDFMQVPLNVGELRARILCAVSRAPRRMILRDRIMGTGERHSDYVRLRRMLAFERPGRDKLYVNDGAVTSQLSLAHEGSALWGEQDHRLGQGWSYGRESEDSETAQDLPIVERLRRVFENRYQTFGEVKAQLISEFESQYVKDALALQNGNVARAAAASGKNRRAFWEIMRKHKIDAKAFRDVS